MDDLISRQALLEKKIRIPIARIVTEDKIIYRDVVFVKDIEALPSAEPELPIKRKCTVCPHCSNCDVNDDGTVKTAEPEIKPISYTDCSNAMLKMWMDNVLTDGEYNRIMDKLNAKYRGDSDE